MALTVRRIETLKPRAKPFKVPDGNGLYLFVSPSGGKIWRFDYRLNGSRKTLSIGAYPEVGLADARQALTSAKQLLTDGVDPSENKRRLKSERELAARNSFREVAKRVIEGFEGKDYTPGTIRRNKWILEDLICPEIGTEPVGTLTALQVFRPLQKIEQRGNYETAIRARSLVSMVFRQAVVEGLADNDPTYALRKTLKTPRVKNRAAVIREDQFGTLLAKIDRYQGHEVVRLALQFLAHTFPRPYELRMMTWDEVDLEESIWHIPEDHMKSRRPHDVHLTPASRAILVKMAKRIGTKGLVFESVWGRGRALSENTMNSALWRMGYKGVHTSHGFRSSASTILRERGYRREVVEMQLSHIEANEAERAYNRALYWDERVRMMEAWSRLVDKWTRQVKVDKG